MFVDLLWFLSPRLQQHFQRVTCSHLVTIWVLSNSVGHFQELMQPKAEHPQLMHKSTW